MTTYSPKERRGAKVPSKSPQYSEKLASLLSFLEEQCEQDDDITNNVSSNDGRGEAGISPSGRARTGLADITNSGTASMRTGEEEEDIKGEHVPSPSKSLSSARMSSAKAVVMREKKYIWDDWEETTTEGEMVLIRDEPKMASGDEIDETSSPPSDRLPDNAQQQLQELKSMSEEIQTRAAAMKIELEHRRKKVEELHTLRVTNESEHVQKMKCLRKEWKKRIGDVNAEHERIMVEQQCLKEALATACDSLEKKMASIKSDIAKKEKKEQETCARLKREGAQQLEEAKKSWQQAEKDALKKKDQRTYDKLRKDAAKAVEPKLRQLMERNKEEIERLEREATRELECYKLELFRKSNLEFKKETNKIRFDERSRMSHHEEEWAAKMDCSKREQENERKKVIEENEQRNAMLKRQFAADKQKCIDEHEVLLDDAQKANDLELEQSCRLHKQEIVVMEEEYSEKIAQKQKICEREYSQWKEKRDKELQHEEDKQLKEEYAKIRSKAESDIETVRRKLEEEANEKRRQREAATTQRNEKIKEGYDNEIQDLKTKLEQATHETTILRQKATEESHNAEELQKRHSSLKESIQEKEDKVLTQERRLSSFLKGCNQQMLNLQEDGERRLAQARNEKVSLEKELNRIISDHPKRKELFDHEVNDLKARNSEEIELAEAKIQALVKSKKIMLEEASAKLLILRKEAASVEKELDSARKEKVLGKKA